MSRPPSTKMTLEQKVRLLEWLEQPDNRCVITGNSHIMDPNIIKRKWEEAAIILNSCGVGAVKSGEKWRKTFNEMRCHINKKKRKIIVDIKTTGGGRPIGIVITEIEQRYLNLFGKLRVDGADGLPELGVAAPQLAMENCNEEEVNIEPAICDVTIEPVIEVPARTPTPAPAQRRQQQQHRGATTPRRVRPYAATARRAEKAAQIFAESSQAQAAGMQAIAQAINNAAAMEEARSLRMDRTLNKLIDLIDKKF